MARQPEINASELAIFVKTIKWEWGYQFTFNGTDFTIFVTSIEELEKYQEEGVDPGEAAEYFASTVANGFDIYVHDTIPELERERVLFHEVLEANLLDQGFQVSEAHKIAYTEEEKIFGNRTE